MATISAKAVQAAIDKFVAEVKAITGVAPAAEIDMSTGQWVVYVGTYSDAKLSDKLHTKQQKGW